jgi:hypothetical protein
LVVGIRLLHLPVAAGVGLLAAGHPLRAAAHLVVVAAVLLLPAVVEEAAAVVAAELRLPWVYLNQGRQHCF